MLSKLRYTRDNDGAKLQLFVFFLPYNEVSKLFAVHFVVSLPVAPLLYVYMQGPPSLTYLLICADDFAALWGRMNYQTPFNLPWTLCWPVITEYNLLMWLKVHNYSYSPRKG
jgi:hypothetical protein